MKSPIDAEAMDAAIDAWLDFGDVQVPAEAIRRSIETGEIPAVSGEAIRRLRLSVGLDDEAIRVFIRREKEVLNPLILDPYTSAFKGMIIALRARELADEHTD